MLSRKQKLILNILFFMAPLFCVWVMLFVCAYTLLFHVKKPYLLWSLFPLTVLNIFAHLGAFLRLRHE